MRDEIGAILFYRRTRNRPDVALVAQKHELGRAVEHCVVGKIGELVLARIAVIGETATALRHQRA